MFIQGLLSVSGSAVGEAAELMHVIPLQLNLSQQEGSSHMRHNHFPRSRLTSQLLEIHMETNGFKPYGAALPH